MQPSLGQVGPYPIVLSDALFVLLAIAAAVSLANGRLRIAWSNWHMAIAVFVAASVASALGAGDVWHSLRKVIGTTYLAALGVLSAHYARDLDMARRIAYAWIAGAILTTAAAAAGVAMFLAGIGANPFLYGYGSLPAASYPRVMALFVNANMLCGYLGAAGGIVLAASGAGWIAPKLARPVFAAIVIVAALTISPGLGGLALAFSLWYAASIAPLKPRRARLVRWCGIAAAVVFALGVLVSPTMIQRGMPRTWNEVEPSSRVLTWIDSVATFRRHPWLGAGPGADVAHVSYINASQGSEFLTDAHNTVLSVLAQTGIQGFIAFAVVIGLLIVPMRRSVDVTPAAAWQSGCELALIAGFLYPSLSGSFEDARYVWVLIGMVHAAQHPIVIAGAAPVIERETGSRRIA